MSEPLRAREQQRPWLVWALHALLVAVAVLTAFGGALRNDFVWDDHEQIVDNQALRHWSSVGSFFENDVLSVTRQDGSRSRYYRPLFFEANLVLFQVFGLDPVAWHALALVLHWLVGVALLGYLSLLGWRPWPRLLATVLFVVHPVHAESVAWMAAALNDPPVALLLFGVLALNTERAERRSRFDASAWLSFSLLLLALLFKESAVVVLPLLCLQWWYQRSLPRLGQLVVGAFGAGLLAGLCGVLSFVRLATWTGVALVTGLSLLAVVLVSRWLGVDRMVLRWWFVCSALVPYAGLRSLALPGLAGSDLPAPDLLQVPSLLLFYVTKALVPLGLAPAYRWPLGTGAGFALGVACLVAAVLGVALVARRGANRLRGARGLTFAGLWFLLALAPHLYTGGFRPEYLVHQRYLYLAVLGVAMAAAWGIEWLVRRAGRGAAVASALVLLSAYGALSSHSVADWKDDHALWQRIVAVNPDNAGGWDWLGSSAMDDGHVDEAERMFRRSVEIGGSGSRGALNLGILLHRRRGDCEAALPYYRLARERLEVRAPSLEERHDTLLNLGVCLAEVGERTEALALFEELAASPYDSGDGAFNAAVLLLAAGGADEARELLRASRGTGSHERATALLRRLNESVVTPEEVVP